MFSFIRAALVMVSFTATEQWLRHYSVNSRASNSAGPSCLCAKPFCPRCYLSSPLYFLIFGVHLYLSVGHIYNTVLLLYHLFYDYIFCGTVLTSKPLIIVVLCVISGWVKWLSIMVPRCLWGSQMTCCHWSLWTVVIFLGNIYRFRAAVETLLADVFLSIFYLSTPK